MLQQHIDKYSSSLNEKSKELERLGLLGEENQRLHDRERFLCNQLIKKTDILYRLKDKAPIHERRAMGRGKGNYESIIR